MKVRKMKELLENMEITALIYLNEKACEACGLIRVWQKDESTVVLSSMEEVFKTPDMYLPQCTVTVDTLLRCLTRLPLTADVILESGKPVLFAVSYVDNKDYVVLEDASVNDLSSELEARFESAVEEQLDELDFFMDLLDTGFTLDDIQKYLPGKYDYSKSFMEEHGLIEDLLAGSEYASAEKIKDSHGNVYDPKDFTIEPCPWCGREQVIHVKGVTRCACGKPLAPCTVCDSCNYSTCPYGCDGSDNDDKKSCDYEALPEGVQTKLYKLL